MVRHLLPGKPGQHHVLSSSRLPGALEDGVKVDSVLLAPVSGSNVMAYAAVPGLQPATFLPGRCGSDRDGHFGLLMVHSSSSLLRPKYSHAGH